MSEEVAVGQESNPAQDKQDIMMQLRLFIEGTIKNSLLLRNLYVFSADVGGQHIVKLTTSPFASKILF